MAISQVKEIQTKEEKKLSLIVDEIVCVENTEK